jgi:hypothetical protein
VVSGGSRQGSRENLETCYARMIGSETVEDRIGE